MKLAVILLFVTVCSSMLHAQAEQQPKNRNIGTVYKSSDIPGWWLPGEADLRNYEVYLDDTVRRNGQKSVSLKTRTLNSASPKFTLLIQQVLLANYQNRRVRFSAFRKSHLAGRANLFLRMDGNKMVIVNQDNMENRLISGTTDWAAYEIVLDVPAGSQQLVMGVRLAGGGQIWVDDATFDIVGQDVLVTGKNTPSEIQAGSSVFIEKYRQSQPAAYEKQLQHFFGRNETLPNFPVNLDFEN